MEKLLDHTLQRQLAEMEQKQNTKIDELTALVRQLAVTSPGQALAVAHAGQVINSAGPVVNIQNTSTQVSNHITIVPWDGERRIGVGLGEIKAAFAENARLQEYASYGDHELTDPEIAPPYVTDLLMDLVKRAHTADPASRNIYLNPRRADQVLVHMKNGRWEVMALAEATRLLFDGVAAGIHKVALSSAEAKALPIEAQNALAMAGMLYEEEPDAYVKRARGQMSAHLENMAPLPSLGGRD